jgi:hypothetical protein
MSDSGEQEARAGFGWGFLAFQIPLAFVPALLALGFVVMQPLGVLTTNQMETCFLGTLLFGAPVYLLVWSGFLLARLGAGPLLIVLGSLFGAAILLSANVAIAMAGCAGLVA